MRLGGTWPSVAPFVLAPHQFLGKEADGTDYLVLGGLHRHKPTAADGDFQQSLGNGAYGSKIADPRLSPSAGFKYGVRRFGGWHDRRQSIGEPGAGGLSLEYPDRATGRVDATGRVLGL